MDSRSNETTQLAHIKISIICYLRDSYKLLEHMKGFILSVVVGVFIFASHRSMAQSEAGSGERYYVTIGVFGVKNNAIRLAAKANYLGFLSNYAVNPKRKLYYVYVFDSEDRRKAYAFLIKLRVETEFKDAWIFTGALGEEAVTVKTPLGEKKEPIEEKKVVVIEEVTKKEEAKPDSSMLVKPKEKKVAKGKFFNFQFVNKDNGNPVRGEIHFQESKRATQYQAFKANELIDLPSPKNADGVYMITTVAPGYKVIETLINFKDPLPQSSGTGPDGEIIIPIALERAKRGDYIEFTNVAFYRNSVILQPQSKLELDGLVDLMKENLNYKVKVHGHCNGNESRDIITLGTSTKFFESDAGNVKKSGSAVELTELRAESVRRYLVSQGISVERILTKGEGGKMMIYPQTSVYANYNDRVEIEIVRH